MALLALQVPTEAGGALTYTAASAGGDTFTNVDDRVILHVVNGAATPVTVTVTAQKTTAKATGMGTVTKANAVITVPAGGNRLIGPFPSMAFNDSNGKVSVGYSATASVTVAAVRVAL